MKKYQAILAMYKEHDSAQSNHHGYSQEYELSYVLVQENIRKALEYFIWYDSAHRYWVHCNRPLLARILFRRSSSRIITKYAVRKPKAYEKYSVWNVYDHEIDAKHFYQTLM